MVELNGVRIWAGLVEEGRLAASRKLVCGTLAWPLGDAPEVGPLAQRIPVPGRPGLSVAWTGWFTLVSTGQVVGVYGAVVEPVGEHRASDPEKEEKRQDNVS